ncbi:MAG TPA: glycosyltransferase family 4 protein [Cytophagaceae bacterium]|jgi:glycogen(starch) synthase|nr:glycosyltransferase family 4 protein [Cytophagaceae bacterium]
MAETTILIITGNLSSLVSSGMGVATSEIAKHLSAIAPVQLIKSGNENFPSIKNVFTINAVSPSRQIVSYSLFPSNPHETIHYDFLISPYRTDYYKNGQSKNTKETVLEIIETVAPSYLEEVALYNQKIIDLAQTLVFDVIYCHDWTTFQAGISLKLITGKRLVLHLHSLETDRKPDNRNTNIYYLERKAMDYADAVITVSEYTKNLIKKNYEIYPDKIHVVYNSYQSIEIKKEKKESTEMTILFMGRLTRQKGIDNFISIAEIVFQQYPFVQFVIAGDGELRTEVEARIENSIAMERINLVGYLNGEEKNNLLTMTDIFCMPSESEPFGLSALEAAAAGIPCVISNQSGIAEILTSALKATFNDVTGFAQHIISLIENHELRNIISNAQLKEIQELSWEKSARKIKEILS